MKNEEKIKALKSFLDGLYPNTECFLNHSNDYELLFAVMMSAQAQDKVVNKVTEILFQKYSNLKSFAETDPSKISDIIKPVGLAPTKSRNIVKSAKILLRDYGGKVPSERENLMSLPGVGYKTASVVRGEWFHLNEYPVDTHVRRIMTRLEIAEKSDTPTEIEKKLSKLYDGADSMHFHRQVITFGRQICLAGTNRHCQACLLPWCKYRIVGIDE